MTATAKHIKHFKDLDFTVVAEIHDYHVDYKVYNITNYDVNPDKPDEIINVQWSEKDSSISPTFVDSLDKAEVYMKGGVKWDGCSNWIISEMQGRYMHACNRAGLLRVGEVMARCWDWTAQLCPNWDY